MSFVLVALAFVVSCLFTKRLCSPRSKLTILDHPNPRSLHSQPTPRGGGLAILVAIYTSGAIAAGIYGVNNDLAWLALGGVLVAGISFLDDWRTINMSSRISIHFAAAALVTWGGFTLNNVSLPGVVWVLSAPVSIALVLLFIVWMINLYNFMDGMDGFAAGMATVGFGCFAVLGWLTGDYRFMTFNLVVAAASGGFLLFNFPPARIFMGDVGSSLLGFLAAVFILWANRDNIFPLWVGVLVFSPFIVDATITLVRRILKREEFLQAHKTHYYQRLVRLGWSHRRTVLFEYGVMLLAGVSAIVVVHSVASVQWTVLVAWLLAYSLIMYLVDRLEARQGVTSS